MKRFVIVSNVFVPGCFGSFSVGVATTTGEESLAPPTPRPPASLAPPPASLVPAPVPLAFALPSPSLLEAAPLLSLPLADPFSPAERPSAALSLIIGRRRPAAASTPAQVCAQASVQTCVQA